MLRGENMSGLMNLRPDDLNFIHLAHQKHPKEGKKAFRKWDRRTPYFVHPVWCATTILTETRLNEKTRLEGYYTLLYHDVLEDTLLELPSNLDTRIKELVMHMTFEGGSKQEMQEIWQKPKEVRLYKLYDKVSNLLDSSWMDLEKKREYLNYVGRLSFDVKTNYGELNIVRIAHSLGDLE